MRTDCILGIDTSNYTTSLGLVSREGELLANIKRPLPVAAGARGLRQSEALFAHVKNLPDAMGELHEVLGGRRIAAVGVSSRPRNLAGSYMPCFLAGLSAAHSICAAADLPLYTFSHQCGHLMAAILSSRRYDLLTGSFGAFHVSGGTTELLHVRWEGDGFAARHVGGTKDLNAGQVIDRIGVMLGLSFPCGPALEQLALQNTKKVPKKRPAMDGAFVNLSGLENLASSLYRETGDAPLTAAFVFDYLGTALSAMAQAYLSEYGEGPLLFAGGVMSNGILRARLTRGLDASFAEPALSADNAVGIACLAARSLSA